MASDPRRPGAGGSGDLPHLPRRPGYCRRFCAEHISKVTKTFLANTGDTQRSNPRSRCDVNTGHSSNQSCQGW
uniref:Uncharacterized protein n=1 Tax=Electrophorus electricus TaxID=8005 RepID=A0AAY5E7Z0_ELEEL